MADQAEVSARFRDLPRVDVVLDDPRLAGLPRALCRTFAREALDAAREAIRGGAEAVPEVVEQVREAVDTLLAGRLRRVINATGVVVHTNLGRAPWSERAVAAAVAATGYCNLEMDLESGQRGGRMDGVSALARALTGAPAALVVNNGAAAVLLALTALAGGGEVLVSRGELVEIGGSFRVPDVVAAGGARLVEVGTTNRTRTDDLVRAIGPDTRVILRVHPSNFRMTGFVGRPARAEVAALARERGLLLVEDLGSGALDPREDEPSVREALAEGVDLAIFSGDKLLGGPQAGVILGRAEVVARLRRHPLYRALRVDKVTLAALEATLADHLAERPPPVLAALDAPIAVLEDRARALRAALAAYGVIGAPIEDVGVVGGGALPGVGLPSRGVAVRAPGVDALARALRTGSPPIVARVSDGALRLDVRTLRDDEVDVVAERVARAVARR